MVMGSVPQELSVLVHKAVVDNANVLTSKENNLNRSALAKLSHGVNVHSQ